MIFDHSGSQHRVKRSRIPHKTSGLYALSASLKNIEGQARALSAEDLARPAESMLESLQTLITDIEVAWAEEIEKRVSDLAVGRLLLTRPEKCFLKLIKLCGEARTHVAPARSELLVEVAYYSNKEFGLGSRFLTALEDTTIRALA